MNIDPITLGIVSGIVLLAFIYLFKKLHDTIEEMQTLEQVQNEKIRTLKSEIESTKDLAIDLNNGTVQQIDSLKVQTPRLHITDKGEAELRTANGKIKLTEYKITEK